MRVILELDHTEAKAHFLKSSSYFNADLPPYINFEPLLNDVDTVLNGAHYKGLQSQTPPKNMDGVNYVLLTNKDGKFAWRPLELIHPAIYVCLVSVICDPENWKMLKNRFEAFKMGPVECVSIPVVADPEEGTDRAEQVTSWWQNIEQQSLKLSLQYSHLLHTDVSDCYGSIYTHSIAWAIHDKPVAKADKSNHLLGNQIDSIIQDGRYGQTNGIPQGSVLMDFIAELVLGYVDLLIKEQLEEGKITTDHCHILRYRDDYRIFTNSDSMAERVLKVISSCVMKVGMKLGASKTLVSRNVVEGSIKLDKLAAITLQDLGTEHAKSIQKQLLRIHAFSQQYPNSGALKRLLGEFHDTAFEKTKNEFNDDLAVQIAILTDIAFTSPSTIPVVAALLSKYLSFGDEKEREELWNMIYNKMSLIPNNGYLEIWLQRITIPKSVNLPFKTNEPISHIVKNLKVALWDNSWVSSHALKSAMDVSKIIVSNPEDIDPIIPREEIELFKRRIFYY